MLFKEDDVSSQFRAEGGTNSGDTRRLLASTAAIVALEAMSAVPGAPSAEPKSAFLGSLVG